VNEECMRRAEKMSSYHAICHGGIPLLRTHMQALEDFLLHSNRVTPQNFHVSILTPWKPG
jgi:hypothetical protein